MTPDDLFAAHADAVLAWAKTEPDALGLTKLMTFLAGRGVALDRKTGLALRDRLIAESLRRATAAGVKPYIHLRRVDGIRKTEAGERTRRSAGGVSAPPASNHHHHGTG